MMNAHFGLMDGTGEDAERRLLEALTGDDVGDLERLIWAQQRLIAEEDGKIGWEGWNQVRDKNGRSLLAAAIHGGAVDHAMLLLDHTEAELESKDNQGRTPLSLAARVGSVRLVKNLIESGADVSSRDYSGQTPLHHAAFGDETGDVVKALLRAGGDVSAVNRVRETALHKAVQHDKHQALKALLSVPAATEAAAVQEHVSGNTALHVAARRGNEGAIRALLALPASRTWAGVGNGLGLAPYECVDLKRGRHAGRLRRMLKAAADEEDGGVAVTAGGAVDRRARNEERLRLVSDVETGYGTSSNGGTVRRRSWFDSLVSAVKEHLLALGSLFGCCSRSQARSVVTTEPYSTFRRSRV